MLGIQFTFYILVFVYHYWMTHVHRTSLGGNEKYKPDSIKKQHYNNIKHSLSALSGEPIQTTISKWWRITFKFGYCLNSLCISRSYQPSSPTSFFSLSQIWRMPKFLFTRLGGHRTGMINRTASTGTKLNITYRVNTLILKAHLIHWNKKSLHLLHTPLTSLAKMGRQRRAFVRMGK